LLGNIANHDADAAVQKGTASCLLIRVHLR
jgi:hypothetical protein